MLLCRYKVIVKLYVKNSLYWIRNCNTLLLTFIFFVIFYFLLFVIFLSSVLIISHFQLTLPINLPRFISICVIAINLVLLVTYDLLTNWLKRSDCVKTKKSKDDIYFKHWTLMDLPIGFSCLKRQKIKKKEKEKDNEEKKTIICSRVSLSNIKIFFSCLWISLVSFNKFI